MSPKAKVIIVTNCEMCPHSEHDNGGGYCEPFWICNKFKIILDSDDVWLDIENEIHEDCKLEDADEKNN